MIVRNWPVISGAPRVRWRVEIGEPLEAHEPANLSYTVAGNEHFVSDTKEGKD